jgi:hypothetical protein
MPRSAATVREGVHPEERRGDAHHRSTGGVRARFRPSGAGRGGVCLLLEAEAESRSHHLGWLVCTILVLGASSERRLVSPRPLLLQRCAFDPPSGAGKVDQEMEWK